MTDPPEPEVLLDHLFRQQAGRLMARLTRLLGPAHVGLAEESVQDAMLRALQTWPHHGLPQNPAGWLFRVAHNLAIDAVRRDRSFDDKTDGIVAELTRSGSARPDDALIEEQLRDDELRMIFMCCHPVLSREASVALSLKTIGGFGVREIARAFLTDESTIAQRIVRAKRQIRAGRLTLEMPAGSELAARLDAVLDVIYFMFNEGYAAHQGADLIRHDLCGEALRLGRLVAASSIASPRTHALVALIALQAARAPARVDSAGDLVLLDEQDRELWDERLIALGFTHFERSMAGPRTSDYHVQAAVAATYARAGPGRPIDWPIILELYDQLLSMNPSPVVALNRAVAVARVHGVQEGLAALDRLAGDPALRRYHLLLAARGHFLFQAGRISEAAAAFRGALEQAGSEPERRFLRRRLDACGRAEPFVE